MKTIEKADTIMGAATILNHYGIKSQMMKCVEELCELGVELTKSYIEDPGADLHKVLEELADVEIMITQMKMHFEVVGDEEVDRIIAYKVNRQLERIAGDTKVETIDPGELEAAPEIEIDLTLTHIED